MNERDARLLYETDHWGEARIIYDDVKNGWKIQLMPRGSCPSHILSAKRGGFRIFKTSDSAISRCQSFGFSDISLQFKLIGNKAARLKEDSENA